MSESKHTPGPWGHKFGEICANSSDGDDIVIAAVGRSAGFRSSVYEVPSKRDNEANARLIAAAPELLAALKMAQIWLDVDGRYDMQAINAALAKAEGGGLMRTIEEIRRTPVGLLTDVEIDMLGPDGQEFARKWKEKRAREDACPGHERVETATREEANRGWHRGECRHCGMNMTYDSGD